MPALLRLAQCPRRNIAARSITWQISSITYFDEYKKQGVDEGLNPKSIVVIQNLIVDVLTPTTLAKKDVYDKMATDSFSRSAG